MDIASIALHFLCAAVAGFLIMSIFGVYVGDGAEGDCAEILGASQCFEWLLGFGAEYLYRI